jgi:POT family proton-dependent oligopeptide transporter
VGVLSGFIQLTLIVLSIMKQPRALWALSLTEMWERFGLYMVQGLLIFYMTKKLHFSDSESYLVMGQFTALVYLSPILGGLCADRLLGFRHTILLGAYLLILGYAILAFPFNQADITLFLGLAIIVLGNGFLKPNISSFLGRFYQADDPMRDAGFTIYYLIFNAGITLATLSSGYIQENWGWYACFGAAALGLVLAIGFFFWGYRFYENKGLPLPISHSKASVAGIVLAGAFVCFLLLKSSSIGSSPLAYFGLGLLIFLIVLSFRLNKSEKPKMWALLILIFISIIFWALFFQIFSVANLFIDRNVDRTIAGHNIPPMAFISLESIFIFLLGPSMAWMWKKFYEKKILISRGLQFTLSLAIIALAMQFLVIGIHFAGKGLVSPYWIVICYFFITVAELLLSPIGLSMVTQLAPAKFMGVMMGVWFLGLSYGGLLAGYLARQASVPAEFVNDIVKTNHIYAHAFQNYVYLGLAAALITLLLTPWLNKLIRLSN